MTGLEANSFQQHAARTKTPSQFLSQGMSRQIIVSAQQYAAGLLQLLPAVSHILKGLVSRVLWQRSIFDFVRSPTGHTHYICEASFLKGQLVHFTWHEHRHNVYPRFELAEMRRKHDVFH